MERAEKFRGGVARYCTIVALVLSAALAPENGVDEVIEKSPEEVRFAEVDQPGGRSGAVALSNFS